MLPPVQKAPRPKLALFLGRDGQDGCTWTNASQSISSSLCNSCFLRLHLVLQQETKQVPGCTCKSVARWPRKVILLPLHPAFARSCTHYCAQVWASQHKTDRDLLQQFHLIPWGLDHKNVQADVQVLYKKRLRQAGWCSLKKRKQMGKVLLVSSTTYLEDAEKAELGSSQRCDVTRGNELMQLHGKSFLDS